MAIKALEMEGSKPISPEVSNSRGLDLSFDGLDSRLIETAREVIVDNPKGIQRLIAGVLGTVMSLRSLERLEYGRVSLVDAKRFQGLMKYCTKSGGSFPTYKDYLPVDHTSSPLPLSSMISWFWYGTY